MLECSCSVAIWMRDGPPGTRTTRLPGLPVCSRQGLLHPASYKVVVAGGPLKFHSNPATTTQSTGLETTLTSDDAVALPWQNVDAKKYISEVSDSSVGSAAVEYNLELLSNTCCWDKRNRTSSCSLPTHSPIAALFPLGSSFESGPFQGCSEPHRSIASIATKRAEAATGLRGEKHCLPGRSRAQYVTEQSSPSTGLRQTKQVGTAAKDWGCGPSAHRRRGSVQQKVSREGAEDTSKQGTGKRNRDWSAKRYRPGTSILIGTLEGLCNCSACAGQHPDLTCTIRCHPAESLPWLPPARLEHRILEAGLSWRPARLLDCFSQAHTRQARLKTTRCSWSKTVCRRPFSLTQYNHAWPRVDRGHQINLTGSPLTDPPRPHETYSHHANVRPRSLSPRPPRPLRPGPSLTAFALTNRVPMPPCFCRAT